MIEVMMLHPCSVMTNRLEGLMASFLDEDVDTSLFAGSLGGRAFKGIAIDTWSGTCGIRKRLASSSRTLGNPATGKRRPPCSEPFAKSPQHPPPPLSTSLTNNI